MRDIKFEIEALLEIELIRCTEENTTEQIFDLDIVESSAIYNQDETISIEKLDSSEELFYVLIKENNSWVVEGYYQAI